MEITKKTLVAGCNYHTTWQRNKAMRFVLAEVKGDQARLTTRNTRKDFWTHVDFLIFIMSVHNIAKAKQIMSEDQDIKS